MTDGDLRLYDVGTDEVVEERVVGLMTARTDVAASTKRRVSWNVERRSGQHTSKSLISITAFCTPSGPSSLRTMLSTSFLTLENSDGEARM